MKYYKDGISSAKQQSKTWGERYFEYCPQHKDKNTIMSYREYVNKNSNTPYYEGHIRVIPSDQVQKAQEWLKRQIAKETALGRSEQVARYQETLDCLTDKLTGKDGTSSYGYQGPHAFMLFDKKAKMSLFHQAVSLMTSYSSIRGKYGELQAKDFKNTDRWYSDENTSHEDNMYRYLIIEFILNDLDKFVEMK